MLAVRILSIGFLAIHVRTCLETQSFSSVFWEHRNKAVEVECCNRILNCVFTFLTADVLMMELIRDGKE